MTKWVEWDEPYGPEDVHMICRVKADEIIKHMKNLQEYKKDHPNYPYKSDQEALDDFVVIHWARTLEYPDD
jgi:hypothetical protein